MHTAPPDIAAKELSFFDETNPRSVVNLLPPAVGLQVRRLWRSEDGYLLGLSEYDLFKELRNKGRQPQAVDNMLRVKFWLEYDRCQETGDPSMVMTHVTSRLIGRESFYKYFLTDPKRLAWMLCPSTDYRASMDEALSFGVLRIRKFFEDTDFEDLRGARDLSAFLAAFRMLDERLNGCKAVPGKRARTDSFMGAQGDVKPSERTMVNEAVAGDVDREIAEREERVAKLRMKIEAGET